VPYLHDSDLPESVRRHLPAHAQEIYRKAFNAAWDEYRGRQDHEGLAHRVAWAAVKKVYVKQGNEWVPRD
jgi:cation transport regulator